MFDGLVSMLVPGLVVGIIAGFAASSFLHWRAGRWGREQRRQLETQLSETEVHLILLANEVERRGLAKIERDPDGVPRQFVFFTASDGSGVESHHASSREHGSDQGTQS